MGVGGQPVEVTSEGVGVAAVKKVSVKCVESMRKGEDRKKQEGRKEWMK